MIHRKNKTIEGFEKIDFDELFKEKQVEWFLLKEALSDFVKSENTLIKKVIRKVNGNRRG